jgi:endonuclease YncB( thermonuclease family)
MRRCLIRVAAGAWLAFGLSAAAASTSQWVELKGCTYLPQPFNDGDSFHVMHNNTEYVFRLYYVDCAETIPSLNQRMSEQAAYWGIVDDQVMKLGKEASAFTAKMLRSPFTVKTCWQRALGRSQIPRRYAFVSAFGQDLGEALVKNGLAQVFGERRKAPPGGISTRAYIARLLRFEAEARKFRRGAWSLLPLNSPLNANRGVRQTAEGAAYVLPWDAMVYAPTGPLQPLGSLRENSVVWIVATTDDGMVRLRFESDDAPPREFRARRDQLGLPPGPILTAAPSPE